MEVMHRSSIALQDMDMEAEAPQAHSVNPAGNGGERVTPLRNLLASAALLLLPSASLAILRDPFLPSEGCQQ